MDVLCQKKKNLCTFLLQINEIFDFHSVSAIYHSPFFDWLPNQSIVRPETMLLQVSLVPCQSSENFSLCLMNQYPFEMSVLKLGLTLLLLMSPSIKSLSTKNVRRSKPSMSFPSRFVSSFLNISTPIHHLLSLCHLQENAAVYSFTAQIDDRTIVAELKEKNTAEKEYKDALSKGQTAVLLRQSEQTLDTFTVRLSSLSQIV